MKRYYCVINDDGVEENFYSDTFPNALSRAILCARQVVGGVVILKEVDEDGIVAKEELIWSCYDEG